MTPTAITQALWLQYGLIVPSPTAGLSWGQYVASGGPVRYIGKR